MPKMNCHFADMYSIQTLWLAASIYELDKDPLGSSAPVKKKFNDHLPTVHDSCGGRTH